MIVCLHLDDKNVSTQTLRVRIISRHKFSRLIYVFLVIWMEVLSRCPACCLTCWNFRNFFVSILCSNFVLRLKRTNWWPRKCIDNWIFEHWENRSSMQIFFDCLTTLSYEKRDNFWRYSPTYLEEFLWFFSGQTRLAFHWNCFKTKIFQNVEV